MFKTFPKTLKARLRVCSRRVVALLAAGFLLNGLAFGADGAATDPASALPRLLTMLNGQFDNGNGIFRSQDGGLTWERRSTYTAQPMYYGVLVADPHKVDRVYSMDVGTQVSDDGGATWRGVGEKSKHVDNHALWIDPANGEHLLNGNDGGLYESRDGGEYWTFFGNLPIAQMYDIDVDNSTPFRVCGGTQDNASFCAPTSKLFANWLPLGTEARVAMEARSGSTPAAIRAWSLFSQRRVPVLHCYG